MPRLNKIKQNQLQKTMSEEDKKKADAERKKKKAEFIKAQSSKMYSTQCKGKFTKVRKSENMTRMPKHLTKTDVLNYIDKDPQMLASLQKPLGVNDVIAFLNDCSDEIWNEILTYIDGQTR